MNRNPKTDHLQIYQYKPGQSGNMQGRPKSYITVLNELGYCKPMIATMTAEIMFMSYGEVENIAFSEKEPMIRKIIASAFRSANDDGEYRFIEDYMKILFGNPLPYIPKPAPEKNTIDKSHKTQ